jgi:hypothetical protein
VAGPLDVFHPERDRVDRVVEVGCYLVVGESEDPEALRLEVRGSVGFVSPMVGRIVGLDDDLEIEAGEMAIQGPMGTWRRNRAPVASLLIPLQRRASEIVRSLRKSWARV